jgi:spermidine synthase
MWQTKLGRSLFVSPSGYEVVQNVLFRWLTLGSSALQTVINRHNPKNPVLHYVPVLTLLLRHKPAPSCLLGLGGAAVAHTVSTPMTAVECSDEVIHIANTYFYANTLSHLETVHQNALDFLGTSKKQFPHLLVDLYDAHYFPHECANEGFFLLCKERLSEDGFLAVNLAHLKEQWNLSQLVKKHFANTLLVPVKGCANVILFATKSKDEKAFVALVQQAGQLKRVVWMPDWGKVGEL